MQPYSRQFILRALAQQDSSDVGIIWMSFRHSVCYSRDVGYPWRNSFGSEEATRGCLRPSIMQFSLLELLLGAITPLLVARML